MVSSRIEINSIEQLQSLAAQVARELKALLSASTATHGITVGLTGNLGAGKTTFTAFLCRAFGVSTPVSSPTFVLSHEYKVENITIEHWDLYRLSVAPEELLSAPLRSTLRVIEWIERAGDAIQPEVQIDILFESAGANPDRRLVNITGLTIKHSSFSKNY